MKSSRIAAVFLISVALGATSSGQGPTQPKPGRVIFSPVPILTPEEVWSAAAAPDKPAAFFDTAANQLVIQVPSANGAALPSQLRYDIPNGARPSITFAVSQSVAGSIEYTYTLVDDPSAPQRSQQFEILLPASDEGLGSATQKWGFSRAPTSFPDRSGTVSMGTMSAVAWHNPSSNNAKVPGIVLQLNSTYLPGFADAFVIGQTGNPLTSASVASLPTALQPQVQNFLQRGIGTTPYLVVAPLFRSDTSKAVIAANFSFGVSALIRAGKIATDSLYSQVLLQALSAFLDTGAVGMIALPSALPSTSIEKEVQHAGALALQ